MFDKIHTDDATGQRMIFTPNGWTIKRENHENSSIVVLTPEGNQLIVPTFEAESIAKAISALAKDESRTHVTVEEFLKERA